MAVTKDDVIEFIANMSVLELSEMIKDMEEKFGVTAAAPVAVAAAAGPAADAGAAAEEKTEFDVVLTGAGDKKIGVIKSPKDILVSQENHLACAYVIYDAQRDRARQTILDWLRNREIWSIGRYGSWEYSAMEDSLQQGLNWVHKAK